MESQCEFTGNSDVLGLGVRVGIYLQWFTSIFAENIYEPAVDTTREANSTFQIAMFAGLVLITTQAGFDTKALEGFIALLFCLASAWISPTIRSAISTYWADAVPETDDGSSEIFSLLLNMAICSYGIWYVFVGIDQLPRLPCPEVVFFFAPVTLFGWFRSLSKAIFCISLALSTIMIPIKMVTIARNFSSLLGRWSTPGISITPPHAEIVQIFQVGVWKLLGGVIGLAIFIATIELTLVWNHTKGVYECSSFSQLFPLVVGATNLIRIVFQLLKVNFLGDVRLRLNFSFSRKT